jgi:ketosteroid isomerase-like protein
MSQENAEIVCRIDEHLNRGEVEAVLGLCDDDFVMDMSGRVFNPDAYRGPDGTRRSFEAVTDAWESYRWDVEETPVTGDSAVAMLHSQAQGHEPGLEVDRRVAWLWELSRGRAVFPRFYRKREDALGAAGLRE